MQASSADEIESLVANEAYTKQVKRLLDVLPEVAKETRFAMHGGTAINLFVPVIHSGNTQDSAEEVKEIKRLSDQLIGRVRTDSDGDEHTIELADMLFVAPYNLQVRRLEDALGARVGSVDKFQGQEAPIVFISLCTSDAVDSPRGIDFLFDRNRLNVAVSRAQTLVVVVGHPDLAITRVGLMVKGGFTHNRRRDKPWPLKAYYLCL